ncbi:ferrochelatase [Candidatus Methylomicrobium oryzae]|jgi:ferrochelatase|uniref:ferrochelatase n=1 Tax=Candidatus Methylomicrobium oryzae TaxID=2802053 RepID=UPI001923522C|nr:ferrochelatase [Methylomicrobium sp. RS1]MBL1263107.1 ferrochelatase [Methylomicrobium sp. RS1]
MSPKKTGVLLVNLGSPAEPTVAAVRRFLGEFLWDPRVVNLPRPLWWLILNLFVLPLRPRRSFLAYRKVWDEKGSPLIYLTRQLAEKAASKLAAQNIAVREAMRYGEPSIANQLRAFKEAGVDRVSILPLYPQYSSTTTASVFDAAAAELMQWRHIPEIRFIGDYYQDPGYIAAVADSIRQYWNLHGKHERLLMSFHGLPEMLTKLGDPYFSHCERTAAAIAKQLSLQDHEWQMVFQSRFGKAEWLKPYCLDTLQELPKRGVKTVDLVCPGFAVDCLETLEEIAIANKEAFLKAGGSAYHYIPALNDSDAHADVLVNLLLSSD